jgi:hypothetical protein
MRGRRFGLAATALAGVATISGCTGGVGAASGLLEREQTPEDRVETASPFETTAFDPESTRLLGEHDGVRFSFIIDTEAQETGGQAECLLAVPPVEDNWLGLCNGGGQGGGGGMGVGSFRYDLGGFASPELAEGEVAVGDYVIVE